jgi:hypothetical protein
MFGHLTHPAPARLDAPFREQGHSDLSLTRGGWDGPNCARPARAFGGRALREHRDRSGYPTLFFQHSVLDDPMFE